MNLIHRAWSRNVLWTFFLVVFFVLGIWTGKAYSVSGPVTQVSSKFVAVRLIRERSDWVGTTTTTTTTRPVVKKAMVAQSAPPVQVDVSHTSLMDSAGIPQSDRAYMELLVAKESGWNPNARNGHSGACGYGQQLPCGKWPHAWNDPVGGLIDMNAYVIGRYGSWRSAWDHSRATGWY